MKILHRFMLKQFIGPFIASFAIVIIVLLMQVLWKYIDDLIGKGLELSIIAKMLLFACGQIAVFAFPLAVLLASIFTLGNMGENYELIALKAAGISLQRIMFPLIILSFFIAIGAFLCSNYVIPVAQLKWRVLIHDIQQKRPELSIQEGIFFNGIDGYSIRIGRRDTKTNMLYDLRIHDHTKRQGNVHIVLADSGRMSMTYDKQFLELMLYNGHGYEDIVDERATDRRTVRQDRTYQFRQNFFEKQVLRIQLPDYGMERSDEQLFSSGHRYMNLNQLNTVIDSLSHLITTQETQLRMAVIPTYSPPDFHVPIDTTMRDRIPDNFSAFFNQLPKHTKLRAVEDAIANTQTQKDRISGLIYELNIHNRQTWRYKISWHEKFSMPFACFVFFFIGAPLGAIIRKGGLGTPLIIAIIFYVLYYVISMIGERSAREGALAPLEGMWLSATIILTVGFLLTWKATRDSSIFNPDVYINNVKKFLSIIFDAQYTPRPEIHYKASANELKPANMIYNIEELSQLNKSYLDGVFKKKQIIKEIWSNSDDIKLLEIAEKYDKVKAIIKQSDIEIIRETVAEYPVAALQNYKIKKKSNKHTVAAAVIFPIWLYLYIKVRMQKNELRNELQNIISVNRNLTNVLNSLL